MTPTINDRPLLGCTLTEMATGTWVASGFCDADAALSGAATVQIDEIEWFGTVLESRLESQWVYFVAVGGAGRLGDTLGVRDYGPTTLTTVLADWARDSGETVANPPSTAVQSWHREVGAAAEALTAAVGQWRIGRDGQVHVGAPAWSVTAAKPVVLASDAEGIWTLADAVELEPGQTWEGRRIEQVVHVLADGRLTTYGHVRSARSALDSLFAALERRVDRVACWGAALGKAYTSGLAEALPDDSRVRGTGLAAPRLILGLPGFTVRAPSGARGLVCLDGGRPDGGRWIGWEQGCGVTQVAFDGGTKAVVRVDDAIQAGELYAQQVPSGLAAGSIAAIWWSPAPVAGVRNWTAVTSAPIPPTPATPGTPITGTATAGCSKLLA